MKITDGLGEFYRIYPNLIKKNQRMSTCNRLDLQTLGSQPIVPKNLPNRWFSVGGTTTPMVCDRYRVRQLGFVTVKISYLVVLPHEKVLTHLNN